MISMGNDGAFHKASCRMREQKIMPFLMSMRFLVWIILALALPMLNSCIDGEEEIFLGADRSARVKAVYRIPSVLLSAEDAQDLRESIQSEVGKEENLRLITNRVEKQNGKRVIILEIETDDVTSLDGTLGQHDPSLKKSKGDKILHAIVGRIMINLDGLSADLTREVDLSPLLDEYLGSKSASMLGDSEFRYTVQIPEPAESSNAHQISNDGRTLKWTHKLIDCREKPIRLMMRTSIPIPWWAYAVVALLLAGIAGAIYLIVRRKSPRHRGAGGMSLH